MRMTTHTPSPRKKKPVNLSIDTDLLAAARSQGINLSALLERALAQEQARKWLAENIDAIQSYNEEVRQHGVWSDGLRRW